MRDTYIPKLQLNLEISDTDLNTSRSSMQTNSSSQGTPSFSDVMNGMVKNLDATAKAPDTIMQNVMTGNGADIHDAMIAISKAELSMNIATQLTTKVIQAYDKVMQIQV